EFAAGSGFACPRKGRRGGVRDAVGVARAAVASWRQGGRSGNQGCGGIIGDGQRVGRIGRGSVVPRQGRSRGYLAGDRALRGGSHLERISGSRTAEQGL